MSRFRESDSFPAEKDLNSCRSTLFVRHRSNDSPELLVSDYATPPRSINSADLQFLLPLPSSF